MIERTNIAGTFASRQQAEQAINALQQRGFSHGSIGLVGAPEAQEIQKGEASPLNQASIYNEVVSLAIQADERWKEALAILKENGAFHTNPSSDMLLEQSTLPIDRQVERHLEYDPITGPRVIAEEQQYLDRSGLGMKRDPALDQETNETGVEQPDRTKRADKHTFFGHADALGTDTERSSDREPPRM